MKIGTTFSKLLTVTGGLIVVAGASGNAHAATLGVELVQNGNAETGDTTGWLSTGINVVTTARPYLSPSPVDIGTYSFTGSTGPADSQALLQSIDVSSLALQIDQGDIVSSFSVLLQSRSIPGVSDIGKATLSFLDQSNNVLLSEVFIDNPVPDIFDWNQFFDQRIVPVNTRSIEIILDSSRNLGISSDSFFDEVSLTLNSSGNQSVPEPTSVLSLIALGVLGFGSRLLKRTSR
ncbi:PEP-CTERM sorting domain-containing protein [Okeania sp. KiyG1]|uniref:PEP-CTERM sorting domain-containing protein n=1 Tax=Okeania sp. KiyG1 TaxID=2720165 RepID=UPI001920548E|nr:PEP-CTERM sorting domain-containing protein [Okeania sp. KiyG1]GFZ96291.1 hypothetical protein CYANOKiyG1_07430 [Okeania sp. KiyG1]